MRIRTQDSQSFVRPMDNAADDLRQSLRDTAGRSETPGLQVVVVDATGPVFEHHQGLANIAAERPMEAASTLMAYSMSKTITAAAVLQLVSAKQVALDHSLSRYLPRQPYGNAISVRQLLSHTAGIPNPIPLRWVHPVDDDAAFDESAALSAVLRRHATARFQPGARFAYSNIGYWLLGEIVSIAAAQRFPAYVMTHVAERLGLAPTQLGYRIADPAAHAAGYLEKYSLMNVVKRFLIDSSLIGGYEDGWLRIRDHYVNGPAFGGLVGSSLAFGRFLQDQLMVESSLFDNPTRALFYQQQQTSDGRPIPMTLGWHIGEGDSERYFFKEGGGGGFHCMMRVYPEAGLGMVVMCNATAFDVNRLLDRVRRGVRAGSDHRVTRTTTR